MKLDASWNIPLMSVTDDVSHVLMSWLKLVAPLNMAFMSVTCDVSHDPIARPFPCKQFTDDDEQSHAPGASAARQLLTAMLRSTPSAGKGAARARSGAIEIATSAPTSAATRA